jgi:hypothetical protein
MSLMSFLKQPIEACRTSICLGYPNAGKTYNMTHCLAYWLVKEVFDEVYLILPVYGYEQKNSYAFLDNYKGKTKIKILNSFHPKFAENLIKQQKKSNKLKIFLGIDDSTHQKTKLMKSKEMIEIATTSRHLNIHTWIIMHYNKGIIPPAVRQNLAFVFVFSLSKKALQNIFEEYNQNNIYDDFDEFYVDCKNAYQRGKYECLLIDNINKKLDFNVSKWWPE